MPMTKPTSEQVTFLAAGSGATQRTALDKLRDVVSVKDFGAVGNGVADDTAAIQAAINASNRVFFPHGTYRITSSITKVGDNVDINFDSATIVNDGPLYAFVFGTLNDVPQNTGLRISGGVFTQSNPSTTNNRNYILIQAISKFVIKDCLLNNVSNGGITVYAGAEDGVIENVTIDGRTNYSTVRGIWLQGTTATGSSLQFVDTNSITRNATPFPIYAVKDVRISNCSLKLDAYGIYLMNSWDCTIEGCFIDISGTNRQRCIAINQYSPRCRVNNCDLISDGSSTGILVTQVSDDVVISNNIFRGSFGGNRAIYVQYLASAFITGNRFSDISTQHIQIDVGGFAYVTKNEFVRSSYTASNRAVFLNAIDPADVGTAQGSTATILINSGVIFTGNLLSKVPVAVTARNSSAASNGNQPSFQLLYVTDNIQLNMDLCTVSSERTLVLSANSGINNCQVRNERNVVMPVSQGSRTLQTISGTAFELEASIATIASFTVDNQASLGALTVTRIAGGSFSMTASRSGADLILSPRTIFGSTGAAIPPVLGITDAGGSTLPRTYVVTPSSTNYVVRAYDSTGTQISFSTDGIKFNVLLGPINSGT